MYSRPVERKTDLEVYRELKALQERLEQLAISCLSLRSRTAIRAASQMCAKLASALFKAGF
jgi:hypothetical protein